MCRGKKKFSIKDFKNYVGKETIFKFVRKTRTTMKKTIYSLSIAVMAVFAVNTVSAQEFNKGTNVINAGIGIGGNFYYGGFGSGSAGLGLNASYERGIWEVGGPGVISLGGYLGTTSYGLNYNGGDDRVRYTIIGVRGAYHFNGLNVENLDVYGGAMASFNIVSYDDDNFDSLGSRPSATIFVGGRWYFTENFGVFAEAGYGVAFLSLGAAFRF